MNDAAPSAPAVAAAAGTVLLTLASGQFLMTLDSTSRLPRVAEGGLMDDAKVNDLYAVA